MAVSALKVISLSRTNKYFRAAVQADDTKRLIELRERVLAVQRELTPPQFAPAPTTAADDVGAWLDAVAHAAVAEHAYDAQRTALIGLLRAVDSEISSLVTSDPDRVLGKLGEDFDALMADVDAVVARLKGATTPAEAISCGTAEAWRELAGLRCAYDTLRVAQTAVMVEQVDYLMSCKSIYVDDELANDISIANLDEVFPQWRTAPTPNLDGSWGVSPPWPADPVEQLVWLSTSAARPWLPTLSELDELRAQREQRRINEAQSDSPRTEKSERRANKTAAHLITGAAF